MPFLFIFNYHVKPRGAGGEKYSNVSLLIFLLDTAFSFILRTHFSAWDSNQEHYRLVFILSFHSHCRRRNKNCNLHFIYLNFRVYLPANVKMLLPTELLVILNRIQFATILERIIFNCFVHYSLLQHENRNRWKRNRKIVLEHRTSSQNLPNDLSVHKFSVCLNIFTLRLRENVNCTKY